MKLFLNCYVLGEGYTTKCFDPETRLVTEGSRTMDEQERTLFIRSNAKMLLADMRNKRFGFVRKIDTGKKDENGRSCMIHIALEGAKAEVDPLLCWAAEDLSGFSDMVCRLVSYEGTEFDVDWSVYQEMINRSSGYANKMNTMKPVALVCPEPSLDYFLKHSGMDWNQQDVERQIAPAAFSEHAEDLDLFFYCPTPSMGWVLRRIDASDGSVKGDSSSARSRMSSVSVKLLDNYGCKMGLFRSDKRQCFIVKDVKADKPDQYGQLKTVSFVAESSENPLLIRQLAVFALLDYEAFKEMLLACVKVSASTVGYRIEGEKLRELLRPFREKKQPVKDDARMTEWEQIIHAEKKPYTYLVLLSSLDYLNHLTGLDMKNSEIHFIYKSSKTEEMPQSLLLETVNATVAQDSLPDSENKAAGHKMNSSEKAIQDKPPSEHHDDSPEESINLLDYPAFKIVAGIFTVALMVGVAFIVHHFTGR